jgi:magnesium-transporting ATPase (P-type)
MASALPCSRWPGTATQSSVFVGLLNALISSVPEIRAQRQLDRMQMLGRDSVWVIRHGHDTEIQPEDVVRGDLVRVRPRTHRRSPQSACG